VTVVAFRAERLVISSVDYDLIKAVNDMIVAYWDNTVSKHYLGTELMMSLDLCVQYDILISPIQAGKNLTKSGNPVKFWPELDL
jgi:hypothetical protein